MPEDFSLFLRFLHQIQPKKIAEMVTLRETVRAMLKKEEYFFYRIYVTRTESGRLHSMLQLLRLDACMPNWPHRHRTPLAWDRLTDLCRSKEECFEVDNLSDPISPLLTGI